jgi:hypothetical protein
MADVAALAIGVNVDVDVEVMMFSLNFVCFYIFCFIALQSFPRHCAFHG